jgi:hypothetical protein
MGEAIELVGADWHFRTRLRNDHVRPILLEGPGSLGSVDKLAMLGEQVALSLIG